MIPKILHYCWFGNNPLSELNLMCLESWKKLMPEYEIMKWNESNADMDVPFMKEAYHRKKYGYLIDHTRLYALNKHGGIFLDLDFLAIKPFDPLLNHDFFTGMIDETQVGMGIIGCSKSNKDIQNLKKIYEELPGFQDIPSTEIATNYFVEAGYTDRFAKTQGDIAFYPKPIFYNYPLGAAYRQEDYRSYLEKEVVAIHLWENTWINPEFRDFWFGNISRGYWRAFKRISTNPAQGLHYYKDLGYHILRHLRLKK